MPPARLAVLRVTQALEKHKAANCAYSAALATGADVTDPWTGAPLRYTKTDAGYDLSSAEADKR